MLKVKRLTESAKLPVRAHPYDAGLDIFADTNIVIQPGDTRRISTGIAIAVPPGCVALNMDRGSLGSKGIHNFAGVVDSEYTGELFIVLHNANTLPLYIDRGNKVAQLVIVPIILAVPYEVQELESTARGDNGFGSTGV